MLLALDNPTVKSKTVFATMTELDNLAGSSKYPVKIGWVKAHVGHAGNEMADVLAKEGTKKPLTEPEPVAPVPKCQMKCDVDAEVTRRWNQRWNQTTTARQSRELWPTIDKHKSAQMLLCNRKDYGELVRLFTGHNYLNRHSYLLNEAESPECRLCNESEETSEHVLCDCPLFLGVRSRILGKYVIDATELSHMPLNATRRLISLIRHKLQQEGLEKI